MAARSASTAPTMSAHPAPFTFAPRSPPPPSPLPSHLTSSAARSLSQSRVSPSLAAPDAAILSASLSQLSQHLGPRDFSPGPAGNGDHPETVSGSAAVNDDAMQGIILRNSPDLDHESERVTGMDVEDELRRGPPTSDTPGGDCKNVCVRHARMANGATNLMLQKVSIASAVQLRCSFFDTVRHHSLSRTSARTNSRRSTPFGACSRPRPRNAAF